MLVKSQHCELLFGSAVSVADEAAAEVEAVAEGITFARRPNVGVSVFCQDIKPGAAVGEARLPQWIEHERAVGSL